MQPKPRAICPECGAECEGTNHSVGMGYQSLDCSECDFSAIDGTRNYYIALALGLKMEEKK